MGSKTTFVIKDELIIEASKDPLFLADIAEIEEDFKYSDYE